MAIKTVFKNAWFVWGFLRRLLSLTLLWVFKTAEKNNEAKDYKEWVPRKEISLC